MTFNELYSTWKRNVNSQYILPTLDKFYDNNVIIPNSEIKEGVTSINTYIDDKKFKIEIKIKEVKKDDN